MIEISVEDRALELCKRLKAKGFLRETQEVATLFSELSHQVDREFKPHTAYFATLAQGCDLIFTARQLRKAELYNKLISPYEILLQS